MKKSAIAVLCLLLVACCLGAAVSALGAERGASELKLKDKSISVDYGRPALNGRTTDSLLGRLPAGALWRLGKDQSTTFKTDVDLDFGGVAVPAGEYSIWMHLQEDKSWKLLFDKTHGQWGEPAPPASEIFAAVPMKRETASAPVEQLTLSLRRAGGQGGILMVEWGTLRTTARFSSK